MHIALWIAQGLLAAMFLLAGFMKLTTPKSQLVEKLGDWVATMPGESLKLIGLLEILGAIGLILPMLLGVAPILTPLAAAGILLTMIGAMILHANRKEYDKMGMNAILLALAVFVVLGRFVLLPIA